MLIKAPYYNYISADRWPQWQLCAFFLFFVFYFFTPLFRWKYGFRTSAPSIKRSWSMAADQRGSISTAPAPSRPARPGCPSSGRSPWQTKGPRCTQTIIWTVLATGTRTTTTTTTTLTRTRCPGLRWCERELSLGALGTLRGDARPFAQSWVVFFLCVCVCVLIGLPCVSSAFFFHSVQTHKYIF